jgi:L-fuconolactonase
MKIIDSHVHLWDIQRLSYPWLEEVPAIKKNFLIEDYQEATANYEIKKMVFVQCECEPNQANEEIEFVMEQAKIDNRIQGIVAYSPLENFKKAQENLEILSQNKLIKGVRRMISDDPNLYLKNDFVESVKLLSQYNLTLDISIKPIQMPQTLNLAKKCSDTIIILDHICKPDIANNTFKEFQKNIVSFTDFENVMIKISGLVTEADWQHWTVDDLRPYIEFTIEKFGFERIMFGSDYPVLLLASSFNRWIETLNLVVSEFSENEKLKLFYSNAERIYKLN